MIPELIEARNFIKMRLDEMEREELFRFFGMIISLSRRGSGVLFDLSLVLSS